MQKSVIVVLKLIDERIKKKKKEREKIVEIFFTFSENNA